MLALSVAVKLLQSFLSFWKIFRADLNQINVGFDCSKTNLRSSNSKKLCPLLIDCNFSSITWLATHHFRFWVRIQRRSFYLCCETSFCLCVCSIPAAKRLTFSFFAYSSIDRMRYRSLLLQVMVCWSWNDGVHFIYHAQSNLHRYSGWWRFSLEWVSFFHWNWDWCCFCFMRLEDSR
jgi:hypothetical protein